MCAEVRSGDTVLIPHGWHGPSMAVPGYDLYYLNVMAGPSPERAWLICDDPAHAWIRGTWDDAGDRPPAAADDHRGAFTMSELASESSTQRLREALTERSEGLQ